MLGLAGYTRLLPQNELFGENQLAQARAAQAVGFTFMGNLDFAPATEQGTAIQRVGCSHRSRRPLGRWR